MAFQYMENGAAAATSATFLAQQFTAASGVTPSPTGGRGNIPCIICDASGGWCAYDTVALAQDMTTAMYLRVPALPNATGLMLFRWDQVSGGTPQGSLYLTSTGTLEYHRGALISDPLIGSASAAAIAADTDYYVTAHYVPRSGTSGSAQAWVNTTQVLNLSSVNTQGGSNTQIIRTYWGSTVNPGFGATYKIGDLYTTIDGVTPIFRGECEILTLMPVGDGFYVDFTLLSGGPARWQAVKEVPPDDTSSELKAPGPITARETVVVSTLGATNTVKAVQTKYRAHSSSITGVASAGVARRAGTDSGVSGGNIGNTAYAVPQRLPTYEADPFTGLAWTVANFNNTEFGLVRSTGADLFVTQMYVCVLVASPSPDRPATRRRWVDMIGT